MFHLFRSSDYNRIYSKCTCGKSSCYTNTTTAKLFECKNNIETSTAKAAIFLRYRYAKKIRLPNIVQNFTWKLIFLIQLCTVWNNLLISDLTGNFYYHILFFCKKIIHRLSCLPPEQRCSPGEPTTKGTY